MTWEALGGATLLEDVSHCFWIQRKHSQLPLGIVAHGYNPSTKETEAERLGFWASLWYTVWPSLKSKAAHGIPQIIFQDAEEGTKDKTEV